MDKRIAYMPAGTNQLITWWRYSQDPDDSIGGSMPSGTVVQENISARIEVIPPTLALYEQGLEAVKLYRLQVFYRAKDLEENDVVEVTAPIESWYFGKKFRVISVQHASLRPNDPRSQVIAIVRRWEFAHAYQP